MRRVLRERSLGFANWLGEGLGSLPQRAFVAKTSSLSQMSADQRRTNTYASAKNRTRLKSPVDSRRVTLSRLLRIIPTTAWLELSGMSRALLLGTGQLSS